MIFVSGQVPEVWASEVARWLQRETGGVLLGYEDVASNLVVSLATRPGPLARHRWFSYEPDDEWDRRVIAEAYKASGRRLRYLGEWHSHSLAFLQASYDDAQTVRAIAQYEAARLPYPLSAIVVRWPRQGLRWVIYQWSRSKQLEGVRAAIVSASDLPEWARQPNSSTEHQRI